VLDQFKGRWLATYDDCERVRACVRHHRLAARGFASRSNHRNKLKYELVIARDLRWLPEEDSVALDQLVDGQLRIGPTPIAKSGVLDFALTPRGTLSGDSARETQGLRYCESFRTEPGSRIHRG
jgi:hypothetical protein